MKYSILTYNNGVGLITDAKLLKDLLSKNGHEVTIHFLNEGDLPNNGQIAIYIQDFDSSMFEKFKINVLYINEEWYCNDLNYLDEFDYIICKNSYAYNLLKHKKNIHYIPFISKSMLDSNIKKENLPLHFAGRSIQKNTESIFKLNTNLSLIDPDNKWSLKFKIPHNINLINKYLSENDLKYELNRHSIHLCTSIYESWGHYLYEGLSTGAHIICSEIDTFKDQLDPTLVTFLTTKPSINSEYWYCTDNTSNIYPFRKSFFIDPSELQEKLNESIKNHDNKINKRIKFFKHLMHTNEKLILKFFESI